MNRKKKTKNLYSKKVKFIMRIFIITLILVGIVRVYFIKQNNGNEYEVYAIENQINKVQDTLITPDRGNILDRNGQALAISNVVYNLVLDVRIIDKLEEDKKLNIIQTLSEILEVDTTEISEYLNKDTEGNLVYDTNWKIIKKKIPYSIGKTIEDKNLTGVYLEKDSLRTYSYNNLASQVIGFVRGDTKWGLESQYDEEMSGQYGRIYRTYDGVNSIVTNEIDSIDGNTIVTTLDLTIQQFAEDIVKKTYEQAQPDHNAENVSIIVMNPKTSEVLAMAEYPNFNLNDPSKISLLDNDIYKELIAEMNEEEVMDLTNKVWKNFSVTETFEPGSTFKPLLVSMALEEEVINETDTFFCNGYRTFGSETIRCHNRSGHGLQTLEEALANSCNTAMMDIVEKLGRDLFYKYQKDFGFGEKTGIDLPGEASASNLLYSLEQLNTVELATSSFGQGFNSTSLQILNAFASSINGGNLMKPYIVSEILDENGNVISENSPEVIRKVLSTETSDYIRKALKEVVSEEGTAKNSIIKGYNLGGKTGTAQQGDRSKNIYTLSFISYFPVEDPEYIAISVIHHPENYYSGTISPVPMLKELFENIIKYKSIQPSEDTTEIDTELSINNEVLLGDYTNKSIKETINELNKLGIDFQISGGGDIIKSTFPTANTFISQGTKVILYVESSKSDIEIDVVPDLVGLNVNQLDEILLNTDFDIHIALEENLNKTNPDQALSEAKSLQEDQEKNSDNSEETYNFDQNDDIEITDSIIISQTPQAGIRIEKGSTIKVTIK